MTGDNGQTFTDVTAPTDVEREGDEDVLGTSVEGTYIDETCAVDSAAATLSELPVLTAADVTLGEDAAWAADLAALGGLTLVAPIPDESETFSVTTGVTETGPTGTVTATTSFAVMLSTAVEAPIFTQTASGSGSMGGSIAPSGTGGTGGSGDTASSPVNLSASGAVAATTIGPTVAISGRPVEGTTLTASAIVTGGFTGTTEFHWQRFYAGSWWNIPIELSPYTTGETFTFVTTPTYVVREEDENVSAIRVEVDLVDQTGVTVSTADSPSIGPVLDVPVNLSLSPISGSPVPSATLTVSAQVVTDEGTFTPVLNWQRFYAGGWWDIPVELSPYTSGEVFTFVTTPTYVVRAEDTNVLAIRVEGTYVDDTGQTFTITNAAATISEPPRLTAANVTLGENAASMALAITLAAHDTDYTLGGVTIGGVPSGWSLSGDGATSIAGGTWTVGAGGLSSLTLVAPSTEAETFTLSVTASETALGPSGTQTATATASFAVAVTDVAERPSFGATTTFAGSEEGPITLSGLSATGDSDDTLSATISGVPAGWTVADPDRTLIVGTSGGASGVVSVSDLGSLVVTAPDGGGESALLTLTVSTPEGGGTSAVEILTVTASAVAERPSFGATTTFAGSEEGPITLSGLSAAGDSDDTLSATISGVPAGWTVADPDRTLIVGTSGGASGVVRVSDLGSLVVTAPDGGGESALLTLTVSTPEGGGTSAVEILTVTASAVAEAPVFGATNSFAGSEAGPITLSGLSATGDSDDTLSATLSGIPTLWTVKDGTTALTSGQAFAASDLGSLVVTAPDGGGETATLTLTVSSSEGSSTVTATEGVTVTVIDAAPTITVSISGTAQEGQTLSAAVSGNESDDVLSYAWVSGGTIVGTAASYAVVETDEGQAITLTVTDVADNGGGTASATATSASVIDRTPTITASISGTAQEGQTLSAVVSGNQSDDFLLYAWISGGTTVGTASTYALAETDEGQAITLTVSDIADFGGGVAIASATSASVIDRTPSFGATTSFAGSEEGGIVLSGLSATGDSDDTLSATISGVLTGWTVDDPDRTLIVGTSGGASGVVRVSDLGSLVVTAPDNGGETATLTLTVNNPEVGGTSVAEILTVVASAVADAPNFGTTTSWSSGQSVTLAGLSATGDSDDTLSATITGLSLSWTLVDTRSNSSFTGTSSITTIPVSDLGSLVVVAPGATASAIDLLTLTISSSEGGTTATRSETLAVTATGKADPPLFTGPTTFYGGLSVTLSSLGASAVGGDTIGPDATITGLSTGWTLIDTSSTSSFTVTSITVIPVSDLGALVVVPPSATNYSVTDVLTLTIPSNLGANTTSGSEALLLVAQKYTSLSGDLTGDNLTNADLIGANLRLVNLTGATLTGATLTNADLTGATLTNANLSGANLSGATLHNASGGGIDLSGADLVGATLHNTDLTSATLVGTDLAGADLHNSNLTDATLTGADLAGADLNSATMTGTTFPLQLSLLGASAGGHDITGDVTDGFTGAVTINAVDNGTTLGSLTISYSSTTAPEAWSIGNVTFAPSDTITVTARDSEGAFYSASGTVVATLPAGVAGSPINLALTDPSGGAPITVAIAGIPEGWSLNAGSDLGNGTWTAVTSDPSALAVSPSGGFVGAVVLPVSESWKNADGGSAGRYVSDNVEAYAPGNPIFALSSADTLTGSGANDLFVFARPIGNDRIYDFKTASNRIDLLGFSGISSFADLQSKMANDANGDAVLTLGSGETITIVGVDAASLGAANFLFNEEPTTKNAGTMAIGDGATLPLGGTVDNSGTIALDSAGGKTALVVPSGGITLEGGGEVTLSDNNGNAIVGGGADTTLTNLDNTIGGAGRLGDASMTLSNAGVIDATGDNPLIIDTGGNIISNSGTIEATGGGGLIIRGAVANSGTLSADGGNLTVDGTVAGAGIALIAGTATFEFGAASAENTSFASGGAGTLRLDQPAAFSGTVSGFTGGDAIDLADLAFGSSTALSYTDNGAGGGVVTIGNALQVVDLALLGQYAAAGFQAQSDPGGGTLITYTLQTSLTDPTSLTNLGH